MWAAIRSATPVARAAVCPASSCLAPVTAVLPPLLPGAGTALGAAATAGLLPADRPGAIRAARRSRPAGWRPPRPGGLGRGDRDLVAGRFGRVVLLGRGGSGRLGRDGTALPDRGGRGRAGDAHGRGRARGPPAPRRA